MKKIFLIVFLVMFSFLIFDYAFGSCPACPADQRGGLVPCGRHCDVPNTPENECEPCQFCHLFVLFQRIVDFILLRIVSPVAILMIGVGGFYFFFTGGSPENAKKGMGIIKATLIGLAIIFSAWLIVNVFFQVIGVAEWDGWSLRESWWQFPCP